MAKAEEGLIPRLRSLRHELQERLQPINSPPVVL